jgi:hypothetical protein
MKLFLISNNYPPLFHSAICFSIYHMKFITRQQASYRYPISWEEFLDPSDSYFLFADFVDFYTHWTYMLIFRHIFLSKRRKISWTDGRTDKGNTSIFLWNCSWYPIIIPHYFTLLFVFLFIIWNLIVGRVFGPIRFLLPVCRFCWFLYTLNIYAHFSSHFSQQLLMAEIWYLVTSFI